MRPHEAVPMQDSPFVARWIALARSMPDPLSPRYRSLLCLPLDPRFDALRAVAGSEAVHAHDAASLERALREVDVATTVCLASLDAELDVPALCALAAALWPGVRVVRASSPETRLDRASGTYARPRRGARAAAPPAAVPQVYLATNKQASLLRMRERDHALRFIDRYELTDLDAGYALLFFHSIEREAAACLLGQSAKQARDQLSASLFPKTGVGSLRDLHALMASFVAELVSGR